MHTMHGMAAAIDYTLARATNREGTKEGMKAAIMDLMIAHAAVHKERVRVELTVGDDDPIDLEITFHPHAV